MPRIFESIHEWQEFRKSQTFEGKILGFVPTMGALHAGHGSLFGHARLENDFVLASIFVNPTQFNDPEDLRHYPKTLEHDLALLKSKGVDFVLLPKFEELYADQYRYRISENELSKRLCGASRPGHFDGVLSVVMKFLILAQAQRAYFGEKDHQQYLLIRGMAEAFFVPTQIIPCPTVREADGLAMSSRNALLTSDEREKAPFFSKTLRDCSSLSVARLELEQAGFRVDYLEEWNGRRFGAVFLGKVRLIDNVAT